MTIVEEQMERTPLITARRSTPSHRRGSRFTPSFWTRLLLGLGVMAVSVAISGGFALDRISHQAHIEMADKFSWLVLVKGDALEIDEVGAQLKLLPGARDVVLITPESAFQDLQNDPLYIGDTNAFDADDLPFSWRVRWNPRAVDFSLLPLFSEDVRRVPGVVEVAYDPRQLEMIHRLRVQRFAVQTALWLTGFVVALGILFLLGRLLFFGGGLRWKTRAAAIFLLRDELWWLGGFLIAWQFLDRAVPWPALLWGLLLGFLHLCWDTLEKR